MEETELFQVFDSIKNQINNCQLSDEDKALFQDRIDEFVKSISKYKKDKALFKRNMNRVKFLKELLNEKINDLTNPEENLEYENILFGETYKTLIDQINTTKNIIKRSENIKACGNENIEKLNNQNEKIVTVDKEIEELDDNIHVSKKNVNKILKNILYDKVILCLIIILLIIFLGFLIIISFAPFFGKILYAIVNKIK